MWDQLADRVNSNASLVRRGQYVNAAMVVDCGDTSHVVTIREGRIVSVSDQTAVMREFTFALRSARHEWEDFWSPDPVPGSHDIMALVRRRVMTVEGDLHPFITNLQYFKDVLAALRDQRRSS
jgi:hypothetical protein